MELLLVTWLILLSLGLVLCRSHRLVATAVILAIAATIVFGMLSQSVGWNEKTAARLRELPRPRESGGYVTSTSCRACHPGEFKSWHKTFHRTMTQAATAATVVPSFDNVHLKTENQSAFLFQKNNEHWVQTVDPGWERSMFSEWAEKTWNR